MFRLPSIIASGMVLQRNSIVVMAGEDRPGQVVSVRLGDDTITANSNELGLWRIELPSQKACGPIDIEIKGSRSKILSNVWFGDVFLLAGQSNMELPLSRVYGLYQKEIEGYFKHEGPVIHQFTAAKEGCFQPRQAIDLKGNWSPCNATTLGEMSAVGMFFAEAYQKRHNVAVGLIQTAVGGSPLEAWCHNELLMKVNPLMMVTSIDLRDDVLIDHVIEAEEKASQNWLENLYKDDGREYLKYGLEEDWKKASKLNLPCLFSELDELSGHTGLIWLRKKFQLNHEELKDMTLKLGTIIDRDDVWLNGNWIGGTEYQYPPRAYKVDANLFHVGENWLVIRMVVDHGDGGMLNGKPYHLITIDKKQHISLRGDWQYLRGRKTEQAPTLTFKNWLPTALFNGMIHPLKETAIKSLLWYQGESNVMEEMETATYDHLFDGFVKEIRRIFNNQSMPVIGVLLAGLDYSKSGIPGGIANFRQVQLKAMVHKGVGMVSAADLGEFNDIHPLRKRDIGQRIDKALAALENEAVYDYPGPKILNFEEVDIGWVVKFNLDSKKLRLRKPSTFQLKYINSESENGYQWKNVYCQRLKDGEFIVERPKDIKAVIAIGYGHLEWPSEMGIFDREGMPVMPFLMEFDQ